MKKPSVPLGQSMHDSIKIINCLSMDELVALNRIIVFRLKEFQREKCVKQAQQFKVGDFVTFKDSAHQKREGIVLRIHQKTIKVFTIEKMAWNVSPTLLTKIKKPRAELEKLVYKAIPKVVLSEECNEN